MDWKDLLDPDEQTLRTAWPADVLHDQAVWRLTSSIEHHDDPRPKLESHGNYVLGNFYIPRAISQDDRIVYQEVGLLLTRHEVLTVRKTPESGPAFDFSHIKAVCTPETPVGMVAYRIVDQVAEGFLKLVDDLHDEIDELEDHVDDWSNQKIRTRLSDLRHDMLRIRRTLAPTRDAVRQVVDNRVELTDGEEVFPRDVELHFGDAYDKLLRCTEGLESARDLIAGVRDYHQTKVSNDQNEIMKVLTILAAIFLPPTFIVGVYGQNFDRMPELHWLSGYAFSWGLVVVSTVIQVAYFRHKGWLSRK